MSHKYRYKRYKVWIRQAEFDLAAAQESYSNNFFEWSCFQSEQSAEKALKGLLAFCGMMPPHLHKLSVLYKYVQRIECSFPKSIKMESLQAVTFVSRYPFIVPGDNMTPHEFLTSQNANDCINEASGVLSSVKTIILRHDYEKTV